MKTLLTKLMLGTVLGATTLVAVSPAEAQRWRGRGWDRGYHRGYDRGGTALAAGVVGLALGAAIVSNNNNRWERDRWYRDRGFRYDYDDYYYRSRGYYPTDGWYADRYRYGGWQDCRIERRFDPYYGRPVRVQVCY